MKEYGVKALLSVSEAAQLLGFFVKTIHRWDKSGKLCSVFRTFGNHRQF